MNLLKMALLVALPLLSSFQSSQPANSQVYFLRPNKYAGSAIAYKVFIDGKLVCHLNNKRFSAHDVAPGDHEVTIQNTGLSLHHTSVPLKITVKDGEPSYLLVNPKKGLHLEEVGKPSADILMGKLKQDANCGAED